MANHSRPIVLSPSNRGNCNDCSGPRRAPPDSAGADHISGAEWRRTGYTTVQVSRIRFAESGLAVLPRSRPRSSENWP